MGVDIWRVDIVGVDILGVGILGRTPFEHFFFFQPLFSKPPTESSNILNTLELHTHNITPHLATHVYIKVTGTCLSCT